MRRGQTASIFDRCDNMHDLLTWFVHFLDILKAKVDSEVADKDPTLAQARKAIATNRELCAKGLQEVSVGELVSLESSPVTLDGTDLVSSLAVEGPAPSLCPSGSDKGPAADGRCRRLHLLRL